MLQLGKETRVTALGQDWIVGRFELAIARRFKDWVKEQIGDPFAPLEHKWFDRLPAEEQLSRIKEAEDLCRELRNFSIMGTLAQRWLATEDGMAKMGQLLLQKAHPDVTMDQAFLIWQEAGPQMRAALEAASGKLPEGNAPTPAP